MENKEWGINRSNETNGKQRMGHKQVFPGGTSGQEPTC